jgi:hypothetical protein
MREPSDCANEPKEPQQRLDTGGCAEPLFPQVQEPSDFRIFLDRRNIGRAIYLGTGCGKSRCREPTKLYPPNTVSQAPGTMNHS